MTFLNRPVRVLAAGAAVLAALAVPTTGAKAAPAAAPVITWGTCPAGTDQGETCGHVTVPLDHDDPAQGTLQIGVSRSRATGTPADYQGILVFNFGGPGATGVGSAAAFAASLPESVRRAYDVIGFDLRGRGTSTRVDCLSTAEFAASPKPDTSLITPAGQQALDDAAAHYADACRAHASPAMLAHLTTRDIAEDLDDVRAAFGAPQLNYLGYSYGTYLGAVYAQLFPGHVRRMVLDSMVDPTRVWYGTGLLQARAFWLRWQDWATWAASHDADYHLGTTRDAVLTRWDSMREGFAAHPQSGLGGSEFDSITISALYNDHQWPRLTSALSAWDGNTDLGPLRALQGTTVDDDENFDAVFQTVTCADAPYPSDPSVFVRDTTRLEREYGYIGASIASPMACLSLQTNTRPPVTITGAGAPPVLMLQGDRDPATPYAGALRLHNAMPSSKLVTVTGGGNHGQYIGGGDCVDGFGTRYLAQGLIPDTDVSCPALPAPDPDHPDAHGAAREPLAWPEHPAHPSPTAALARSRSATAHPSPTAALARSRSATSPF